MRHLRWSRPGPLSTGSRRDCGARPHGPPTLALTRQITADTALRLARYFGTTDRFWLNLQTRYDLEIEKDHLGATLEQIQPLQSA